MTPEEVRIELKADIQELKLAVRELRVEMREQFQRIRLLIWLPVIAAIGQIIVTVIYHHQP
ncbi:MAG TPA: hypothetical protein VH164_08130 [Ktedonobacteraceae bacterium]|jgi:hypothetical protein|nr:hypothetical protein [Ktedonobacteraceae bacterium]